MKLKFDANQEYQIDAISAAVDLFEGQDKGASKMSAGNGLLGIYPNVLSLSKDEVLANCKRVQEHNKQINFTDRNQRVERQFWRHVCYSSNIASHEEIVYMVVE
jgi:type III restriction enzyme